jgi:hypothetical protein
MGIDLYCGDCNFNCNYRGWSNIREGIIIATFKYINTICSDNKTDERNICRQFHNDLRDLNDLNNANSFILSSFYDVCNSRTIDALIYARVGGIYSLINKSDCEGLYSVGNSYDICELFKLIKPYLYGVKESKTDTDPDDWLYNLVENELEPLFKASVDNQENVIIC